MSAVYSLKEGASRVIVSIPHSGTHLAGLDERLTHAALQKPDTDWHLPRLYGFLADMDVTVIAAKYSRYVVDLNRDPAGASLYPGQNVTELCPTTLFDEGDIYYDGQKPDSDEISQRVAACWHPYHDALAAQIERVKAKHGQAVLFDAHSIASQVPRFFEGQLPDFNLGTNDGDSCDVTLAEQAFSVLAKAKKYSAVHNGRFKGGYITRHYGAMDGVDALQLELSQATYMDEAHPFAYDNGRASEVREVLQKLVESLG